jgi:hypothetical protein
MDIADFIIIVLLMSSVFMWIANFMGKCPAPPPPPPPEIIYRYKPELDLQFNENNFPSKIYDYVFTGPNVYQGGYHMDQGRVVGSTNQKKQQNAKK